MTVIFVSGTIGSGKSQFCNALLQLGAEVVSADQIVANFYKNDLWCSSLEVYLKQNFRDQTGSFSKEILAAATFAQPALRDSLESFIHPQVRAKLEKIISVSTAAVFVYEIPILRTTTDISIANVLVRVDSSPEIRLMRLVSRGMRETDALARMNAQDSDQLRNVAVDIVVTNDGSIEDLQAKALQLYMLWSKS